MANIFPAISDSGATMTRRIQVQFRGIHAHYHSGSRFTGDPVFHVIAGFGRNIRREGQRRERGGFFYFYGARAYGCNSLGKGIVRVNRQPEHGAIKTQWRKLPMTNARGCRGKVGQGLAVWYIPHKGYRGVDKFSFTMSVPGLAPGVSYGGSKHWNIKVNVK